MSFHPVKCSKEYNSIVSGLLRVEDYLLWNEGKMKYCVGSEEMESMDFTQFVREKMIRSNQAKLKIAQQGLKLCHQNAMAPIEALQEEKVEDDSEDRKFEGLSYLEAINKIATNLLDQLDNAMRFAQSRLNESEGKVLDFWQAEMKMIQDKKAFVRAFLELI